MTFDGPLYVRSTVDVTVNENGFAAARVPAGTRWQVLSCGDDGVLAEASPDASAQGAEAPRQATLRPGQLEVVLPPEVAGAAEPARRALAEVVLAVALADADLGEPEQARLRDVLIGLAPGDAERAAIDARIAKATLRLEKEGVERILEDARASLEEETARRLAVLLAFDVTGADGMAASERTRIRRAATVLGVSDFTE